MKVLVSGITERCENVFKSMSSIQWMNIDKVGEESSYCHILHTILVECIPKIRDALPPSYFNNFCTKLSTDLLQRYHDIIVRQKRISEMGCQQLLLDTYNIKTLLLYLHNLSTSTTNSTTTTNNNTISSSQIQIYSRIINTRTSHIEMILKLVTLPNELLVERFLNMWSDGTPADLQMIMTLKGIKKQEQFIYLEALGTNKNITINPTTNSISNSISSNVSDAMSGAVSGAVAAAFTTQASLSLASSTFTSTARSAVGNLKWVSNSNNNV
uniref:Vps53 C-terminal domain-containing protein n=1 Tax=Chromulina nebulosa TaxID=96789 RepID=A0A7S0XBL0_9STRA